MTMSVRDLLEAADIPVRDGHDEAARSATEGFQSLAPHRPELVAYPATTDEVATVVRVAASAGLPVAVSNTGHGRRLSLCGGLLLSLSRMRAVAVEAATGRVRIGGGARWADVVAHTASAGLAVAHGSAPGVGVAGYLLGGGFSIYGRPTGLAANTISSLTLVTPDGGIHALDRDTVRGMLTHAWQIPAADGIVTEVVLDTWPAGTLTGGGFTVAGDEVRELLTAFQAWAEQLPDHIAPSLGAMRYPDKHGIPGHLRGRLIGQVRLTALDDHDRAARAVAALAKPFTVIDYDLRELPWTEAGSIYHEPDTPRPHVGYNTLSKRAPDLDVLWPALADASAPPRVLDARHYTPHVATADDSRITAPGTWLTGLLIPTPADPVRARLTLRTLLAESVVDPTGVAANFSYGPTA